MQCPEGPRITQILGLQKNRVMGNLRYWDCRRSPTKAAFKYSVITFLAFLGPPTSLMIYRTVNHQKLPFSDPTHPPL